VLLVGAAQIVSWVLARAGLMAYSSQQGTRWEPAASLIT
jgi:hypothetical protein